MHRIFFCKLSIRYGYLKTRIRCWFWICFIAAKNHPKKRTQKITKQFWGRGDFFNFLHEFQITRKKQLGHIVTSWNLWNQTWKLQTAKRAQSSFTNILGIPFFSSTFGFVFFISENVDGALVYVFLRRGGIQPVLLYWRTGYDTLAFKLVLFIKTILLSLFSIIR